MKVNQFWYIVAESRELKAGEVLGRVILGEWLAIMRDSSGHVSAIQDKCLHRNAQLSKGKIVNDQLHCPYHGWAYNGKGQVTSIPSMGPKAQTGSKCTKSFNVVEFQDYIYVCLSEKAITEKPFLIPKYKEKNYTTIRLQNKFLNNVINCAENFVDIPHTTYVHPKIFRDAKSEKFGANVIRENGSVKVSYKNETKNFGFFSFFLNSSGKEIGHTDEFFLPNITCVQYFFGGDNHFIITSQSVPVGENETLVYTDLTYNYGLWTKISRPLVRKLAQKIIDQDVEILNNQMKTINRYGMNFQNSPADIIHTWIESLAKEMDEDRDPFLLPRKEIDIEFWV